jgi:hypothetical protein
MLAKTPASPARRHAPDSVELRGTKMSAPSAEEAWIGQSLPVEPTRRSHLGGYPASSPEWSRGPVGQRQEHPGNRH